MTTQSQSAFGQHLKYWRGLRGMSQLALSVEAGVSSRHLSFVETGRSRPGKDLILRLSDTLDIPPRERSELMKAAGLPPLYPERELSDTVLNPYSKIIQRVLDNHEPYPAYVFDRWWTVVNANRSAVRYYPQLAKTGVNAIDVFLADLPPHIVNRHEVGNNLLFRVRRDWAMSGHDDRLSQIIKRLEEGLKKMGPAFTKPTEFPVITTQVDIGESIVSMIGTVMRFDTASDITLDELRIELHFPADAQSAKVFGDAKPAND